MADAGASGGGKNPFTTKIGPLPAIAWAGIAVGGFLIYRHFYTGKDDGEFVTTYDDLPQDDVMAGFVDAAGGGNNDTLPEGVFQTNGMPPMTTNEQWARVAADALIGLGNEPLNVQTALRKYLRGQALSASERSIIRMALSMFGSPPEGVIPAVLARPSAPPSTSPSKKPPLRPLPSKPPVVRSRRYTVARGDSLAKIAAKFYRNSLLWRKIYDANRAVIGNDPDRLSVGMVLVIP